MNQFSHFPVVLAALALSIAGTAPCDAALANAWIVPAAAHTEGALDTFWYTDLALHNPHSFDLPVAVLSLPSNTSNHEVFFLSVTLYPFETYNLWDVLGPDWFDQPGTGALLVTVDDDPSFVCSSPEDCDFLVTSRTYTLEGAGEYGQTVPGLTVAQGVDWWTFGYGAGIMNDQWFRTNVGVASWTGSWITVDVDTQDAAGAIVATQRLRVPPFGHVQRRLGATVTGGSVVFYIVDGPDDALVYPYATVINQESGDSSFVVAQPSVVGVSIDKQRENQPTLRQHVATPSFPATVKQIRATSPEPSPRAQRGGR